VTDAIDDCLDAAEGDVLDDSSDDVATVRRGRPRQLFDLSKTIVEFRRNAAPLRDVVAAVLRRETSSVGDAALVHFQDLGDHVLRVAELLESQRDVLTNLRDAELAVVSNRLNRSMQKLTAWGAILIVATLITGVLGMNFKNAPGLDWRDGFLLVAGIMAVVSLPMFLYFRRKQWL
jgi:magnesium transporter